MHDCSETGFRFNDNVGNSHLATESWEEDDKFDRVYIVCDDDERGFLSFDQSDAVVETVFNEERFLVILQSTQSDMISFTNGV